MIDGTCTTVDWQTHPTDILILPVGSFEQHSVHLPLDTDGIQAEYFAKCLAEDLDAAVLPAIRIATSMEHTGFRGSFSLRPETLMQVVRDIADEAERQGFRLLVVVNAHGGNHALVPVCRDINRCDRPLKIILVDSWMFRVPDTGKGARRKGLNFHAHEPETSFMLAQHPELVRSARPDAVYAEETMPLVQSDLTAFGVGHLNAGGTIGWPSDASREKGESAIATGRRGMLAFVKDRIERLRRQPRYAGPGGLAVRAMIRRDIADVLRLGRTAGRNLSEADLEVFLGASPQGCLVAVHNGSVVGAVTALNHGNRVAWIGPILVNPSFLGINVERMLMEKAIAPVEPCEAVGIDATTADKELCVGFGFREQFAVRRMAVDHMPPLAGSVSAEPITAADLSRIAEMDAGVSGADRSTVLKALHVNRPDLAWMLRRDKQIVGYIFGRSGDTSVQLGPLAAETAADARELLAAAFARLADKSVVLDMPDGCAETAAFLSAAKFEPRQVFTRMLRGTITPTKTALRRFVTGGADIG